MTVNKVILVSALTTLAFLKACGPQPIMSDEALTFQNNIPVSASEAKEEASLSLEDKAVDDYFYDPISAFYGLGAFGPHGYYGYPAPYPYAYGFYDYYLNPLVFEIPTFSGFPVLRYEHPFYAPYLLGLDPILDDDDLAKFVDDE